jgi:hypothetical protein
MAKCIFYFNSLFKSKAKTHMHPKVGLEFAEEEVADVISLSLSGIYVANLSYLCTLFIVALCAGAALALFIL